MQGVLGSSDATGHLATVIADAAGPARAQRRRARSCAATTSSTCRLIQAETVPEATPQFAAVDPDNPPAGRRCRIPFFLKPVTAHLSQLAYTVHDDRRFADVLAEARDRLDAITAYDAALDRADRSGS